MSEQQKTDARGRAKTDFSTLVGDLNAGVYLQQINTMVSDIAAAVCSLERKTKGKITLELEFSRIGDGAQVNCTHKLKAVIPRLRGKTTEENAVDTPLHVAHGGVLSLFPNTQTSMELGAGAATGARAV